MKEHGINFDLHALANPKSRQDCTLLAQEILAELANIRAHFERAAARCEQHPAVDDAMVDRAWAAYDSNGGTAREDIRAALIAALANVEHRTDKLREEIEALQDLCAAAYQMAGVHDAPVEWLDALSNAANGKPFSTDGLLPYMPKSVCDAEARAERLAEALQWYVDNDDTNDGQEGNEYWLAGRDRAIALLREQGETQ